ncbi:ABC transporter permease [Pseudovibrio exalbescens]|uniref:ABC-2 type transporter transmembrane domain-containing protein n=1 Tax=Pseudovibrio exalbescens TaxID=197461 RepID=A0A1U7JM85_9HYPH|nr:ABC transporter permease [Pseudovibrio exalbescens]OKL45825.1 hypothetical protein A3843_01480 [Pseudovibrio exalbescens]
MRGFVREVLATFQGIARNRAALSTMVAALLIYSVFYPQPYRGEVVREVPMAVVDQDQSTMSRDFIRRVDVTDSAHVAYRVPDMLAAQDLFFERKIDGIVVIPPDFEQNLLSGERSPVAYYGDGSYFLLYGAMKSAVLNAAQTLGAEVELSRLTATGMGYTAARSLVQPITITNIRVFNPQGGYASYVVPAAFILIMQQTLMMGIGMMHSSQSRQKGGIALAAPTAYVLLYAFWSLLYLVILPSAYGIPRIGEVSALFLLVLPFLCAVTALGHAVAALIPWKEGVVFFFVVLGMPLFLISGISWPIEEIPRALHLLTLLIPSTSVISGTVRIDQMGADLSSVLDVVYIQLALTGLYSAVTYLTRWLKNEEI